MLYFILLSRIDSAREEGNYEAGDELKEKRQLTLTHPTRIATLIEEEHSEMVVAPEPEATMPIAESARSIQELGKWEQ